uniref:Triple gene block protein 1 n=1 Tax=Fern benyvirus TaxID=2933169 RepID=A0A9C7LLU1_9VIRU|nr:triple gene block protein 1 [Fern benyvirus]CAI5383955.1 triple gene block protein 1 [Fern benyvirus]
MESVQSADMSEWAANHPGAFYANVERLVKSKGFTWTGKRPLPTVFQDLTEVVDGNLVGDLEEVALSIQNEQVAEHWAGVLEWVKARCHDIKPEWKCYSGIVSGPPGCGKSSLVKELLASGDNLLLLVPFQRMVTVDYQGLDNVMTLVDFILRPVTLLKYHAVLVDEYTLVNMALLFCVLAVEGINNLVCFGDSGQASVQGYGEAKFYKLPVLATSSTTHRLSTEGLKLYNLAMGTNLTTTSSNVGGVDFMPLEGACIPDDYAVLCATNQGLKMLEEEGIEARCCLDVQGCTFDNVAVVVLDSEVNDVKKRCVRSVLLSRQLGHVLLVCESATTACMLQDSTVLEQYPRPGYTTQNVEPARSFWSKWFGSGVREDNFQ